MLVLPDLLQREAALTDERFFVPAYYGPYGWVGLDFRAEEVDWDEVADLVEAVVPQHRPGEPARAAAMSQEPVAVPAWVAELAGRAPVTPVWRNGLGGLTFRFGRGEGT
ncbi:MAG: hypothetical protein R2719_01010 [Micropruina sp.]